MPRKSPEAISGSLFRAGSKPPRPPRDLDATAARLWRDIAAVQPADFFRPATLRLLSRFCRLAVYSEKLHDALDAAEIGSQDARQLLRQVIAANSSLGILASKMRLTTQGSIDRRSGHLGERGADRDRLLGGSAVVPIRGGR